MKKTVFALALGASTLAASFSAAAEQLSLAQISDYFNSFKTAEAEFSQVNDDGSTSTGKLMLKRPGRMRFEYDAPHSGLVVARAGTIVIVDPKSPDSAETYPLRRTPLSLILANRVNLDKGNMVTGHRFDGEATIVTALDPKAPENGTIDLFFTGDPVRLSKWVIENGSGETTTVTLGEMTLGQRISNRNFEAPHKNSTD